MTQLARIASLLVAFYLILGGCASASKTYDAQGREAYTLNCSAGRARGQCAAIRRPVVRPTRLHRYR